MTTFVSRERARQVALRETGLFPKAGTTLGRYQKHDYPFVLPVGLWTENIDPGLVRLAITYAERRAIRWHDARHHLLSSQICCLNHLLPFATEPAALARLLEPVFGADLEMLPIVGDGMTADPWYVALEYFGPVGSDFLNEGAGRALTRGANCTSVDAAVRFRRGGRTELVLIEWKYGERYDDRTLEPADLTRERRYRPLLEAHGDLFRSDVSIPFQRLLVEPFYQMFRQQLLAREMERVRTLDCDVVRVLHLAPRANTAFAAVPVAEFRPYGATATGAWTAVLAQPDRFTSAAIEDVFGPSMHEDAAALLTYARRRYAFTHDPGNRRQSLAVSIASSGMVTAASRSPKPLTRRFV